MGESSETRYKKNRNSEDSEVKGIESVHKGGAKFITSETDIS